MQENSRDLRDRETERTSRQSHQSSESSAELNFSEPEVAPRVTFKALIHQ